MLICILDPLFDILPPFTARGAAVGSHHDASIERGKGNDFGGGRRYKKTEGENDDQHFIGHEMC